MAGTQRWVFFDPATGDSWTVPRNPNSMTDIPHVARRLRQSPAFGPDQQVATFEQPPDQLAFKFGGSIDSEAHYDSLLEWSAKENEIQVTDHLGRNFIIFPTAFTPEEQKPTRRNPWRINYTFEGVLLVSGGVFSGVAQEVDSVQR